MCTEKENIIPTDGAPAFNDGDAVGLPKTQRAAKRWYVAVVNNNSERACRRRLEERISKQPETARDYEVYVPVQQEIRLLRNGKRKKMERVVTPALLFIHCTESVRRKEIAYLPYIKRFLVNHAGTPVHGHRPVATIPEAQMRMLKRMVDGAEDEVQIGSRPPQLGERVRVKSGRLQGLEGNVLRHKDGTTSFVVLLDVLGCARVTLPQWVLEGV